jgi:hypothetical protein
MANEHLAEWLYSMGLPARMKIKLILFIQKHRKKLCIDCRAYMRIMAA